MRIVSICFLMMILVLSYGQEEDLQQTYPFLQLNKNEVEFPGDSTSFYRFYQKLDTLFFDGKGQVNIVHMGGSHVQAGTLSNRMRENMQTLSPGTKNERGFFFPYSLAHTNNPSNYKVVSNGTWEGFRCSVNSYYSQWGASGVNATTQDSNIYVKVYARKSDTSLYRFKKVRVFYLLDSNAFEVVPHQKYALLQTRYDSVAGYVEFEMDHYYDTLHVTLQKKDSTQNSFTIQGVQYISEGPSLNYNSIGVNGASTKSYIRCVHFQNQLPSLKPDLVIFGIGINDAYKKEAYFYPEEFEANYDSLINMYKRANPDVSFLFLSNNDSYYKRRYPNPNALKVSEVMLKLCKKHGAAYWDLFEIMGGFGSIKIWEKYGLAKADKIHFTKQGYILQGDLMFEALMRSYGGYLKNQSSSK